VASRYLVISIEPLIGSAFALSDHRGARGKRVQHLRIDWSNRLNFATDMIVIGAFMSPAAVALWAVPARCISRRRRISGTLIDWLACPIRCNSETWIRNRIPVASRESRVAA